MTRFPTGGKMLHDAIVKNRYSFEEPRNLSCGREYRSFLSTFRSCNTVTGIYQGDFSTLSHIRFLWLLSSRRLPPEGKRVTGFSVAFGSLQHGYQRLTMICASLSLLQIMFAAVTPVPLPPLEMQQSCRGLLSRAQVGAFTAH